MMRNAPVPDLCAVRLYPMPVIMKSFHAQIIAILIWTLHYLCCCWTEQEFIILGHKLWDAMERIRIGMYGRALKAKDGMEDKLCYHVGHVLMIVNRCWEKLNFLKRKRTNEHRSDFEWVQMRKSKQYFESILLHDPEKCSLIRVQTNINARDVAFLSLSLIRYCFGEVKGHGMMCNLQSSWHEVCDCERITQLTELLNRLSDILSNLPSQDVSDDPLCEKSKVLKHQLFRKYRRLIGIYKSHKGRLMRPRHGNYAPSRTSTRVQSDRACVLIR